MNRPPHASRHLHVRSLVTAALVTAALGCSSDSPDEPKQIDDPFERIDQFIADANIDKSQAHWREHLPKPPQLSFESSTEYRLRIETNKGEVEYRLLTDIAPMHVSSTIFLARLGYYDGLRFHRVIPGFMAQGGDPLGNGRGGPGYVYEGEFSSRRQFDRGGLLAMANAGPGTDGSQIFLTFVPTPWLNGKHTIFGEIVSGDAVLDSLEAAGTQSGVPSQELSIERFTIEAIETPRRVR